METTAQLPPTDGQPVAKPDSPEIERRAGWRLAALVVVVLAILCGLAAVGIIPRIRHGQELQAAAQDVRDALPVVQTAAARRASPETDVSLPGSATPRLDTAIYARTNGYLKRWLVDIGDHVEEGQLIAEIDTPEIDDELLQARATLNQAKANRDLAKANANLARTTLARAQAAGNAVSAEEIDQQRATVGTTQASVEAAEASIAVGEANVRRLEDLQKFEKLTAPFAGRITARNVDPGALITAGQGTRELFHIAQTRILRVFVTVPETYVPLIRVGQSAELTAREIPGRTFVGTVGRTAGVLDPATRSLLTQVDVENHDFALSAGMYLQVRFRLRRDRPPVIVPASALVSDANGTRVAILDKDSRIRYRAVGIGRDYGTEIEILTGLDGTEEVVISTGQDLPEGTAVQKAAPTAPAAGKAQIRSDNPDSVRSKSRPVG